jgi:hypothetical protein
MFLPSRHLVVLVIILADLWRAMPSHDLLWAVVLCDGVAAGLIFFAKQIDEITFGTWQRGYQIDRHTPPFLIAGFGWVLLLSFSALLFFGRLVRNIAT